MIEQTAQALAKTWPAWSPQAAHKAALLAGLTATFAVPALIPSGQIRTYKRETS